MKDILGNELSIEDKVVIPIKDEVIGIATILKLCNSCIKVKITCCEDISQIGRIIYRYPYMSVEVNGG